MMKHDICHDICDSQVSMVVIDGLATIWCQDIYINHDDIAHLMYVMGAQCDDITTMCHYIIC